MTPTWLDGLGLAPVREGVWRHEATGLEVEVRARSDRDVTVKIAVGLGRSIQMMGYDYNEDVAEIMGTSVHAMQPNASATGCMTSDETRTFAAALALAADLADRYNREVSGDGN